MEINLECSGNQTYFSWNSSLDIMNEDYSQFIESSSELSLNEDLNASDEGMKHHTPIRNEKALSNHWVNEAPDFINCQIIPPQL